MVQLQSGDGDQLSRKPSNAKVPNKNEVGMSHQTSQSSILETKLPERTDK